MRKCNFLGLVFPDIYEYMKLPEKINVHQLLILEQWQITVTLSLFVHSKYIIFVVKSDNWVGIELTQA